MRRPRPEDPEKLDRGSNGVKNRLLRIMKRC
jgi:hypothetical protein